MGAAAEDAACALLQRAGLQLLERNARYPFGELDLVMLDGRTVVFVEVRLRRDARFGGAMASIDAGKRRKLARAAEAWRLANARHRDAPCRFDVVATMPSPDGLRCEWIRNAFTLDDL